MIRDVFYLGNQPNAHPREKFAKSVDDAKRQSTTEHFWIINEYCDYRGFDWDWDFDDLPDEERWAENHINVWPSQHQKDSGTWLCSKNGTDVIIYRADVSVVPRKNIKTDNWNILDNIDELLWDWSWHHDPTEPPFIYRWGTKLFPVEVYAALEYKVPGATQVKYMPQTVTLLPDWENWNILHEVDKSSFDFTWRPHPNEPPFIYVWGNQWYDGTIMPTVEYRVPNATNKKYMYDNPPKLLPNWENWSIHEPIDKSSFDFTWRPHPNEPPFIYIWGNQWYDGAIKPTLEYRVPGATQVKYMTQPVILLPNWENWSIHESIDKSSFDFTWRPHPNEPPFIYVWGNQWYDGTIMPTIEYIVPGATDRKYMSTPVPNLLSNPKLFSTLEEVVGFDYSWRPNPTSPPYIYVWGNQWNPPEKKASVIYTVPNATEYFYMTDRVKKAPDMNKWIVPNNIDCSLFDFSWEPPCDEPPFIYEFGTQHQTTGGPQYVVPNATVRKYISVDGMKALATPNPDAFINVLGRKIKSFDWSWHPNNNDEPFIYVFGNQWYDAVTCPTLEYHMPNATQRKYIYDVVAVLDDDYTNWNATLNEYPTFDFSWIPNPTSPPYVYQFGTKINRFDGPIYSTPGHDQTVSYKLNIDKKSTDVEVAKYDITTTLHELILTHPTETFWATRKNIDYSNFDFDWRPPLINESWETEYVHVFGSAESELTQTYFVCAPRYLSGNTNFKFVDNKALDSILLSNLFVKPSMFFIDRGNDEATTRFNQLSNKFSNIQRTRFVNSWVSTISRCIKKSDTELVWILDSILDYTDFDFNYYPNPWQLKMITVFGTQWSHWGTTFLVNKNTFDQDTKYVKIIEHLDNLNFVSTTKAKATNRIYDIVLIKFNDTTHSLDEISSNVFMYDGSYLSTFKQILQTYDMYDDYIWICSDVCDYSQFDFSYIPDPFASDVLHVFPSSNQRFGDTFLVKIDTLREIVARCNMLIEYSKIKFEYACIAHRKPIPQKIIESDTHTSVKVDACPYELVVTSDNINVLSHMTYEPPSLWDKKEIKVLSNGGTAVLLPKEVNTFVKNELYDYPYITKEKNITASSPMDVVFLSNGEDEAEENWNWLVESLTGYANRLVRVDGINGRTHAYHAVANASNTPWVFTVFGKLRVNSKFDWNWQPDRLQQPKHYIFHAINPVNDLVYGHQGMIAYNKRLALANIGDGIDFTLSDPHEVVPLVSGTAHYNTSPFATWRTAFREAIKLRIIDNEEAQERLDFWINRGRGKYGDYSMLGAKDGLRYYDEVCGDEEKLKLSYEWSWLHTKWISLYGN